MTRPLKKTTIVIWSERDLPSLELSALAREAEQGEAYCSVSREEFVEEPESDPDWDGTEFFDDDDLDDGLFIAIKDATMGMQQRGDR